MKLSSTLINMIKNKVFLLLVYFLVFLNSNLLKWETSISRGFQIAKQTNRPIFVNLYADWCELCKTLETEIYPNPKIKKLLTKFVVVNLDGEVLPYFKEKYGVKGYPAILILDKYGAKLELLNGMPTLELLQNKISHAYSKKNLNDDLKLLVKKNPIDSFHLFNLGEYYFETDQFDLAVKFLKQSYYSKSNQLADRKHETLNLIISTLLEMDDFSEAKEYITIYLKEYKEINQGLMFYYRALCYYNLNDYSNAKSDLDQAKKSTSDHQLLLDIKELYLKL